MAYVWTWDQVLNLLGSRDADEIDDSSREAHAGLTERFEDILEDVNGDPWKLKAQEKIVRVHYSTGFLVSSQVETLTTVDQGFPYISPVLANGSMRMLVPIVVPKGEKLSKVRCRVKLLNIGASFTASVKQVNNTGVATQIGFASSTGVVNPAFVDLDTSTSPTVCGADDVFYVEVQLQNPAVAGVTASFMDVEVTLNTP